MFLMNFLIFLTFLLFINEYANYANMIKTSDGSNGNHSVSLPIILIKIKVDRMLPYSYISSLFVSIL